MLDFPNTDTLQPQPWVGRDLGSYLTFNWKMIEAFEYSKTLVNELLKGGPDDDLMEDIIVSLAKDKDGPQVDLRNDLVHHFAQRASMITRLPPPDHAGKRTPAVRHRADQSRGGPADDQQGF